jgi:uncharacterized protein (TIGR00266 family)
MEISTRHSPAFGVARCSLSGGEVARAESGAMMATSAGVDVQAQMQGGLMKSLKRSVLGGESLFVTTFTAPAEGGWVDVAANLPGDVVVRELGGTAWNLSRGSYLCSEASVEIDTRWGGFRNLFGGEGGFLIHATGAGKVVASCYGALDVVSLGAGERLVVDAGHMVAFQEGVEMTLRRVSGTMASLKSGEGLVFEFTGPGEVLMQSRNPGALITWLTQVLPFSRS